MNQCFTEYVFDTDEGCDSVIISGNCFVQNNSGDIDEIVLPTYDEQYQITVRQFNKVWP